MGLYSSTLPPHVMHRTKRLLNWTAAKDESDATRISAEVGTDAEKAHSNETRLRHWTTAKDVLPTINTLIEVGTDVEAASSKLARSQRFAAESDASAAMKNASTIVKALIEAGANVNAADSHGQTPLHHAAENGSMNAVQFLLGAGADLQLRDNYGKTPLQLAIYRGYNVVAKALEKEADHRAVEQAAQQELQEQEASSEHEAVFSNDVPSSYPRNEEQTHVVIPVVERTSKEQPRSASYGQAQSMESSATMVGVASRSMQTCPGRNDVATLNSNSTYTSEEATDQVRAVQDLREDDIFADNYCVERKIIFGKPLVRVAKGLQLNTEVVLKFYVKPELYAKALSSYESLNKSEYICKPIEKINAHQGFPDCLAFEKGIHTLDEWLRIPGIGLESRKEALKLVAASLYDLHSFNVVHCDVKPANLAFFPAEHKWKLLDIDSALKVGVLDEITTTISYSPPEVLEAVEAGETELAMQPSADMWAYGIIAFEVFTGMRFYEFEATTESVLEFLRSERFMRRLDEVEDRKHRRFIKKFLKWNASERESAYVACTSSIFVSATVTVSKSLASHASGRS